MTVFGNMFRADGTCERVSLPETIGELVVWYKKNASSCNDPDLVNLKREDLNNGYFKYTSCICDSDTTNWDTVYERVSLGDIIVFRTIIPAYTFQTMEDRVYSIETNYLVLKNAVEDFRKLGLRIM